MEIGPVNQRLPDVTIDAATESETNAVPSNAEPAELTAQQEGTAIAQAFNSFAADRNHPHVGIEAKRAFRMLQDRIAQSAKSVRRRYGDALGYTAIPERLHIVHFGGSLPADVKENIEKWAESNSHWEKNLWVDRDFLTQEQMNDLKQHADQHKYNLRFVNDEIHKNPPHPRLALARQRAMSKQLQAVETPHALKAENQGPDVPDKNWGLVSDLARVEILMKEGGLYVDTDMAPGKRLPNKLRAKHGFLVNLKGSNDSTPSNDIIATTSNNKALFTYANDVADHYFNAVHKDDNEKMVQHFAGPLRNRNGLMTREAKARLEKLGLTPDDTLFAEDDLFSKKDERKRVPTIRVSGPSALENALKKVDPSLRRGTHEEEGYRFPAKYVADHQNSAKSWLSPNVGNEAGATTEEEVEEGTATAG